ncbi:MAG TPA: sulfatase-like hydrolase/transferase [Ornithinibacter sp.]|nr:sulfatase-like hydrolase/transferase [Ornithinibacter sp.]
MLRARMRRSAAGLAAVTIALLGASACSGDQPHVARGPVSTRPLPTVQPSASTAVQATSKSPNIVFVLMDDFSMDLLPTLRNASRMAAEGASYPHSFVVDSLCCVSRSATFTGQYPHQTGVLTNTSNLPNSVGPMGGWPAFQAHGDEKRTFAVHLQRGGYTTGFVGKYLNQYNYQPDTGLPPAPPGWSDLRVVFESAYKGWDFNETYVEDGRVQMRPVPAPPALAPDPVKDESYAGTVIANNALDFIHEHADDAKPYFLEVAPYATHSRIDTSSAYPDDPLFPPAFRDRPHPGSPFGNCGAVDCRDLTVRNLPGYADPQDDNAPRRLDGSAAPTWNPRPVPLPPRAAESAMRNRARMAQSVDRMLGRILRTVDDNTYVVLTSDNGFHLGQHGLSMGKGTAYASDIQVPLVVVGPGVPAGPRQDLVSNVDLAPTFEDLAGLRPPAFRSGRSLAPSLRDPSAITGDYAFVEHTWSLSPGMDPDRPFTARGLDVIPSYVAVRSRDGLLVRDDLDPSWLATDYAYEFYDYTAEPWERTNRYGDPRYADEIAPLMGKLAQFDRCSSAVGADPVRGECRDLTLAADQ